MELCCRNAQRRYDSQCGCESLKARNSFGICRFGREDPYGTFLMDEFKRNNVDVQQVYVQKGAYTGIVLAIIDDQGERTFIACARGASHIYLTEEIASNLIISKELVVHSSGVCLVEEPARTGLVAALRRAHENNNLVYFDPNLRLEGDYFADEIKKAQLEAISLSDVVLIGDNEIILLYPGCSVKEGAMQLLDIGAKLVIVKQGENGASAFDREHEIVSPAFKTNVVSTAGAGDSFDAGFIAARIRQMDIHEALEYANAVAAIKVSRQVHNLYPVITKSWNSWLCVGIQQALHRLFSTSPRQKY